MPWTRRPHLKLALAITLVVTSALQAHASESASPAPDDVRVVAGTGGDGLNLRDAPSLAAIIITAIPEGAEVDLIVSDVANADGLIWSQIAVEGTVGYSASMFLAAPSDDDLTLVSGEPLIVMHTDGHGLNLRSAPSMDAAIITAMPEGTQVRVAAIHSVEGNGLTWVQIEYDGAVGYSASDFLEPAPIVDESRGDTPTGHLTIGNMAVVHGTVGLGLNVRTGPSDAEPIVTAVNEGTEMLIIDGPVPDADGNWWYAADINGARGWVHGDYLVAVDASAIPLACGDNVSVLGMSDALNKTTYEGNVVGGLSALATTFQPNHYLSLVDRQEGTPARLFTIGVDVQEAGVIAPQILGVTTLHDANGNPFMADALDGEGMVVLRDGTVLIASETEPSIRRFSADGQFVEELSVPDRFRVEPDGSAQENETLEGLSVAPDGHDLLVALESPLHTDGWSDDGSGRTRMVRYEAGADGSFHPAQEFFYLTERGGHVTDVLMFEGQRALVIERITTTDGDITVRLFSTAFNDSDDVRGIENLASGAAAPLAKTLLVDLGDCVGSDGASVLDNYEGLAFGPRLDDGRQVLLLQSDDNFDPNQRTRLLALAVEDGEQE